MSRLSPLSFPHLLLGAGALLAGLTTGLPRSLTTAVLYLVVVGVAGIAACVAVRSALPATPPTARLGAVSIGLYVLGDLAWWILAWTGRSPDGSVADLLYLASYATLGGMLVLLLMPTQSGRWVIDVDVLIDVLSVVSVSLLVLWEFMIRDTATSPARWSSSAALRWLRSVTTPPRARAPTLRPAPEPAGRCAVAGRSRSRPG